MKLTSPSEWYESKVPPFNRIKWSSCNYAGSLVYISLLSKYQRLFLWLIPMDSSNANSMVSSINLELHYLQLFRSISSHPKSSKAHENLALLYYEKGEFQKAKDLYEKLISISLKFEHKRNYVSFVR